MKRSRIPAVFYDSCLRVSVKIISTGATVYLFKSAEYSRRTASQEAKKHNKTVLQLCRESIFV